MKAEAEIAKALVMKQLQANAEADGLLPTPRPPPKQVESPSKQGRK